MSAEFIRRFTGRKAVVTEFRFQAHTLYCSYPKQKGATVCVDDGFSVTICLIFFLSRSVGRKVPPEEQNNGRGTGQREKEAPELMYSCKEGENCGADNRLNWLLW